MPRRVHYKRRSMRGGALMDWIKKAHNHVKSNKLVSKGIKFAIDRNFVPDQFKKYASVAGDIAGVLGYGRRRRRVVYRRRGGALMPAGY